MSDMRMSAQARAKLTEPWEECVLYVYDDKVGKRHIDGKLQYPEWDGGAVRGTLTIGFGHTDAAGSMKVSGVYPHIVKGLRITREQADQIFDDDIAPCERAVDRALKVAVTQHQFDALVDTWFNCPAASLAAIRLINAGNSRAVPAKLLQYTSSRGEHMEGLVHRRAAEIAWFNTPDEAEGPPPAQPDAIFSPKAERNAPPKGILASKQAIAGLTTGAGGVFTTLQQINDAAEPLKAAKQNLLELGVLDHLAVIAHAPAIGIAIAAAIAVLGVFVFLDRRAKLENDHV